MSRILGRMNSRRKITREQSIYRCSYCKKFIPFQSEGFFDLEDRSDEFSSILVFCNEDHADKAHMRRVKAKYDEAFIYTAPTIRI